MAEAADDVTSVADTIIKAVYNLEVKTSYYPDMEGGESVTTEEDLVSASRSEEADQGPWSPA